METLDPLTGSAAFSRLITFSVVRNLLGLPFYVFVIFVSLLFAAIVLLLIKVFERAKRPNVSRKVVIGENEKSSGNRKTKPFVESESHKDIDSIKDASSEVKSRKNFTDISLDLDEGDPLSNSNQEEGKWYDVQTKFDLAKAYQEMGDREGALQILMEVLAEGDDEQKASAKKIISELG